MDLNATLIGQMITFAVFVVFTMKYVWPPITKAMEARAKKIADGLAAGEAGQRALQLAQQKATEILREAKATANQIMNQAQARCDRLIEEATHLAEQEGQRRMAMAQSEIKRQFQQTQQTLQAQAGELALQMAEKILSTLDPSVSQRILDERVAQV